jgi:hypothetical protein
VPNPGPTVPQSLVPSPSVSPCVHPADKLGALLIKLMFAARRLVQGQTRVAGFRNDVCAECQARGFPGVIAHGRGCRTGEVDGILSDLVNLYQTEVDAAAQNSSKTSAPPQGEFGEPWIIDPECPGQLLSQHGLEVYDSYGTELMESDEEDYAARIAACVNACAGIPTESLLRNARPAERLYGVDALFGQKPDEKCTKCHRPSDLCVCAVPFQYPDVDGGQQ